MASITLARALKYKNRLVNRINKLDLKIQKHNSSISENEYKIDVQAALAERKNLVNCLINLKLAITQANEPIRRFIFAISEAKTLIDFLGGILINDGISPGYGMETPITYKTQLTEKDRDELVEIAERAIDEMQDKLDRHNHSTHIEVNLITL